MPGLERWEDIKSLKGEAFLQKAQELLNLAHDDRRTNNLSYYQPVSRASLKIHQSTKKILGVGGGNRSSKTETCLVEMFSLATGVIPMSLRKTTPWKAKFRGPVQMRVVCQSLTSTLRETILPKLQYWNWLGADRAGGKRGHYGWVPQENLRGGDWDKSWLEKTRTLRFLCRDPEHPEIVLGESSCQFNSHDQDPEDFASGSFHHILHDEPPRYAIWRENEARVMENNGRLLLAMTWPDNTGLGALIGIGKETRKGNPASVLTTVRTSA